MIDRHVDRHTHSTLTDGADTPEAMADAAVAAGLSVWGLSDHVRINSHWVLDYVPMVRALRRPGLRIEVGVEAKILDTAGRLDLPPETPPLDYVLIADHQFPGAGGPVSPRVMAQRLASGEVSAAVVLDELVTATAAAVQRSPARPIVVHAFSLLPKMGLTEDQLTTEHLDALAAACLAAGASVESNEKWSCPSPGVLVELAARGVPLVAGSDAHAVDQVGRWRYLDRVDAALATL